MHDRVGELNINNQGLQMEICFYRTCDDVDVRFMDGTINKHVSYKNFKNGSIKNYYHKEVYGVGYIGAGCYKSRVNGVKTPQYEAWFKMLTRCYSVKYHLTRPTYKSCSVCDDWLNFQRFAKWYDDNYYEIGGQRMEIDKDISHKGNKIYSPDNCLFVPQRINVLFTKSDKKRGKYPIGVTLPKRGKRYKARCHNEQGSLIDLGLFDTTDEAFRAYRVFKKQVIAIVANLYRDVVPIKLHEALLKYDIAVSD